MVGSWQKRGLLLAAPLQHDRSVTHAALPTVGLPRDRGGDVVDLYVSTRDRLGRSWIARALLDLSGERPQIAALDPEPVLAPGDLGAFDDAGVTPSCVLRHGNDTLLYYTGWSRGVSVARYLAIGLAVSSDNGPFARVSRAPVLGRTATDPFITASPHVLREPEGWRMWYVSCARWVATDDGVRHYHHLRHATSQDGVTWETTGRACLDFADEHEYAFSRPCVVRGHSGYEMWFSVRGEADRLGYARSANGLAWQRCDAVAGLAPSDAGWDDEMVAYPHVFEHRRRRLMLYNGNGHGATGVGYAVAE